MMSNAQVLSDQTSLGRLDRSLYKVEAFFALGSGVMTLTLMVLAVISVSGRHLFNAPLPGYVDWISQAMPFIAFLGLSYTHRDGGHIRMDLVIGRFQGRWMWLIEMFSSIFVLGVIILLIWGSWSHFDRSFDWASPLFSRDSTIDINLPIWPTKLLVPIMFSVLALRTVLQIWAYARAFANNTERPIAVPLPQSIADQAMAEAAMVDKQG
ncbi:MAG: TRAP transporter small permease [Rhodobacteraceae bacterium]|nr:TRAP transporter small permease [Paracoccaceae bacterium]